MKFRKCNNLGKIIFVLVLILLIVFTVFIFSNIFKSKDSGVKEKRTVNIETGNMESKTKEEVKMNIYLTIGKHKLLAELVDNSSTRELTGLLKKSDITIEMSDYGNFEKVGSLGVKLSTNDENIKTSSGDLILYNGDSFVIYYDTNSWNFTKLGKIKGVDKDELKEILGKGKISVKLSLN